jgi:hypothetical protein
MVNKPSMGRKIWEGWKRIAAKIAHFQGQLILSVIYLFVVTPIACLFRLFGQDALSLSGKEQSSYWIRRVPIVSVSAFLRRMY